MKKGYKIVSTDSIIQNFGLCSYNVCGTLTEMLKYAERGQVLKYRVGEWTHPHKCNGPLALFSTLESARAFDAWGKTKIFACDYIPSQTAKQFCMVDGVRKMRVFSYASGEVLASAIRLTEEVSKE